MRIASFNVQNLFDRAKAMNMGTWTAGRPILEAYTAVNTLFQAETYDAATKRRILARLEQLGLLRSDAAMFAILRVVRGRLLRRHRDGSVEVVADGRASWVGWVELTTESVDELAMQHTAMVVRDVDADVLGVVEAEDRITLQRFSDSLLAGVGGSPVRAGDGRRRQRRPGNRRRPARRGCRSTTSARTCSTATPRAWCSPGTAASTT